MVMQSVRSICIFGKQAKTTLLPLFLPTLLVLLFSGAGFAKDGSSPDLPPIPTPGMVTMVQLETQRCPACKMMKPVIEELQKEYSGRVSIISVDVGRHRALAYKLRAFGVPTQILYDRKGNEVGRHMGYLDKKSIEDAFEKLGVVKGK